MTTETTNRGTSRLRRVAMSAALVLGSGVATVAVASPAEAATWHTVSKSTSCHTYSFGTMCTVKRHKFRQHSSYCRNWNPDPENWYKATLTSLSMYQYCYRYSESTYWK